MAASGTEIEEFLGGPLISWITSCLPNLDTLTEYTSLFDGEILHQVYLQIDPEPSYHITKLAGLEDQALILGQVKNFDAIIKNVKGLYEEELGMTLLVVPECICLGKSPESRDGLENMKLLILLLLGAAVQCPNKEIFITRIKELDLDLQHNIVECIKQVTDMQTVVLTPEAIDLVQPTTMFNHMRRLAKERDHYLQNWASLVLNEGLCDSECITTKNNSGSRSSQNVSSQNNSESQHLAVELADWKARLRKQRQELEEKSEQLAECREDLEHTKVVLAKLRVDSQDWFTEARKAAAYRDEVDALKEKADRCDRLEQEIQRYRDRLADAEYYKTRVAELREDNKALMETRDAVEEQLQRTRKRAEQCLALEAAMIKLKREANDIALERDADQQKIQDLIEENNHLQYVTKSVLSESNNSNLDTDNECESTLESGENSLSEQLTSNAQARALKLELENKRLLSTIDNLKEQSLLESSDKILELEKEKKRLTLKCEQLQENCNRMAQQNSELEEVFKNALEENRKLQDSLDSQKAFIDRQAIDRESEKNKLQDFERHLESLTKDKQRIQMLCDSIQRRADDLEKTLDARTKELNLVKPESDKVTGYIIQTEELKTKLTYSEKETHNLQREVNKLRETLEEKDVSLDKLNSRIEEQGKEIEKLTKELDSAQACASKLHDLENKVQELLSQNKMDSETIQTLQKDLITEKVNLDKVKNCMEKLGINISDIVLNEINIEELLEKIITNSDHETFISEIAAKINWTKSVPCNCNHKEKLDDFVNPQIEQLNSDLAALQASLENSQAENAKLQVNIATLNSQNGSLISQQMTLQLANSQLAAEKEEIIKQLELLKDKQDNLLRDQVALQTLHEQLNTEYEMLLSEREPIKATVRDLKLENRELKEKLINFEKKLSDLELERENLKIESKNLVNLRAEHSKLKDDFRNLFTASDRLKTEYRNMQEEYRSLRSEVSQLKLRNTEMSGEINTKNEIITSMDLEINKTNQHCEMLVQMNKNLDTDRRSLMDHVSQLLTQYHELLAHSLKDKQHYHEEEKMFADKVNALCRQKEKLEEKIMEHYKKLDNCTTKRKGFGSSFVKRVRKAGTDLMSKVPSRNNKRIEENRLTKSQLTLAGSESGESDPGSQETDKASKISDPDQGSSNPSNESPRHSSDSNFSRRFEEKLKTKPDTEMSASIPSLDSLKHREGNLTRRLSTTSVHSGGGDDALIRASLRRRPHKTVPSSHRNSYQGLEADNGLPAVSTPSPVFGTAGSRRTVYVADDNADVSLNSRAQSTPLKENPTYLVYNRISTVIGEGACQNAIEKPSDDRSDREELTRVDSRRSVNRNEKPTDNSKESAIWYEYGCV